MQIIAIWTGKVIVCLLRFIGRRGSALPGLIIEKLFPSFLVDSLKRLPEGVIVVTGTNGKTTSTKMLTHVLKSRYRVISNPTGSNFTRGIVSSIIHHSKLNGSLPYDLAVIELDEAYAARFASIFSPRAVLVTNIMRDQMDRFGEIDHTAKLISKIVKRASDFVVLNRDDPRVAALADNTKAKIYYFGVSNKLREIYKNDDELHLEKITKTDLSKPLIAELDKINEDGKLSLILGGKNYLLKLDALSSHNAQNAIAVSAVAKVLDINDEIITTKLSDVKPAFGRGERIALEGRELILQLVKNPNGFRHALISQANNRIDTILIAINDNYADGRDVSWLWDVSFKDAFEPKCKLITCGSRAYDMALRLKYDNVRVDKIEPSLDAALSEVIKASNKSSKIIIFTTYTAMLYIRKSISKVARLERVLE